MELVWQNIHIGFVTALDPSHLLFCILGAVLGLIVGIIPGIGSAATIAILLPVTFHLSTTSAIIMLCGIWYGSMFGGGITAILLGIPGQATAVMTIIDGYPMARRGESKAALVALILASFIGGLFGFVGLALFAPLLADVALSFGPPEYFVLAGIGLFLVSYLVTSTITKALISAAIGLLLGFVGLDPVTAESRFTLGILSMQDGIHLIPMIMGLFGVSEILRIIEETGGIGSSQSLALKYKSHVSNKSILRNIWQSATKGSLVGFIVGLIPGAGATIASYVSYALVKRWSKKRAEFGTGIVEGVAAPESANNAATASGMIPLLILGLPADIVPAMMLGAFAIHGFTPGPQILVESPEIFWGIVTSFLIGNIVLLGLLLPLLPWFEKLARIPSPLIVSLLLAFVIGGSYTINLGPSGVYIAFFFGIIGYLMRKFDYPLPPLILAFILGPIIEFSFRQSIIISRGDFAIFTSRPITAIVLAILTMVISLWFISRFLTAIQLDRPKK